MLPTFPPEIWITTAQFIPSSILRNLYSVNPIFLHLALDDKYSDVNLVVQWTVSTSKYIKHLNHPHIAHRIRRLTLASNWVEMNMHLQPSEQVTLRTRLARYLPFDFGGFIDPLLRRISNVKMCKVLMEDTVLNFQNLSSLIILDGSGPSSDSRTQTDPLLLNVYTACASNLRTLGLLTKYSDFNVLFPPNPSALTSLEEVTLSFHPQGDFRPNTEVASTFFQTVASRLTTLNITSGGDTSDEPLQLLQSFPHQRVDALFPKLTSFSLFHLVSPALPSSNLTQFLNQHADTLKHLRLQHTEFSSVTPQSHMLPVLPHLESLNILNQKRQEMASWEGLDVARVYVQHSMNTLTSLALTQCSFTLHDLGVLLDLFGRGSSEGGLKSLTVSVQILTPHLLDMLAEKLPQLERLKIDFAYLRSADDLTEGRSCFGNVTQEDIESFHLEMTGRSYSKWSLKSFGIENDYMMPNTAMVILMPLMLCIPHLVEIDGASVKMWRDPGSTWKASDYTKEVLAAYNLSIGSQG